MKHIKNITSPCPGAFEMLLAVKYLSVDILRDISFFDKDTKFHPIVSMIDYVGYQFLECSYFTKCPWSSPSILDLQLQLNITAMAPSTSQTFSTFDLETLLDSRSSALRDA